MEIESSIHSFKRIYSGHPVEIESSIHSFKRIYSGHDNSDPVEIEPTNRQASMILELKSTTEIKHGLIFVPESV